MSGHFLEIATKRRSIYVLGNDLPLSKEDVAALIKEAVRQAPSSFNSQSSRVVVLFGEEHKKLWEITREQLRKIVPAENFQGTSDKMDMFAASAGSVLFFEDETVIAGLQEQFPSYADNFPIWSEHSTGIAQYAVWLALAEQEIGANLQHYTPLIDNDVREAWDIPASWKLRAHLNFGSVQAPAKDKTYIEDDKRFKVLG
ncbi:nitroreductase family protein [Erwinia sp. E602]|uniref:nitroreductase family protein n=1 Tax=unclassified Erwinia TaxID=2622719 RepID=UPI0006F7B51F|nr:MULTISPECIES: nitroreductase family protein [unclassified Erwinia]KQN63547.1 nitroreductase [Erwinia sp. Leaf53]PLV54484.1 nitroreductase [Erwinia sp. B116]QUG75228.1 nitroreductase family protein [Erwinia sp. E602]